MSLDLRAFLFLIDRGEALGTQASYTSSSKKVASTRKLCGDCEHSSLKYTKVVSHNARVEMAKKKGLCFRSLILGHGGGGEACPGVAGHKWEAYPWVAGRLSIE